MQSSEFNQIVENRLKKTQQVLVKKAGEYAQEGDRLHNFRAAMGLTGKSMRETLGGMMLKHTVSIYDMINTPETDYPQELWDEKIGDHINYLLLLEAVVEDEKQERVGSRLTDMTPAQKRHMGQKPNPLRPYGGEEPNARIIESGELIYAEIVRAEPMYAFVIRENGDYARMLSHRISFDNETKSAPAPYGGNKPNALMTRQLGGPEVPVFAQHGPHGRSEVTFEDGTSNVVPRGWLSDITVVPANRVTPQDDEAEDNVANAGMWGSDPNTNKE